MTVWVQLRLTSYTTWPQPWQMGRDGRHMGGEWMILLAREVIYGQPPTTLMPMPLGKQWWSGGCEGDSFQCLMPVLAKQREEIYLCSCENSSVTDCISSLRPTILYPYCSASFHAPHCPGHCAVSSRRTSDHVSRMPYSTTGAWSTYSSDPGLNPGLQDISPRWSFISVPRVIWMSTETCYKCIFHLHLMW